MRCLFSLSLLVSALPAAAWAQAGETVVVIQAPEKAPPPAPAPTASHGADLTPRPPRGLDWDLTGSLHVAGNRLAHFATDRLNTAHGQRYFWQSRLLAGGRMQMSTAVRVEVEVEALSGMAGGDPTTLGLAYTERPFSVARDGTTDLARVVPRKAVVAYTGSLGQITLGAQTFSWGTGMLANDGAGDNPFGDSWLGNAVARLSMATKPLAKTAVSPFWQQLAVFGAVDAAIRDDNATLFDGDTALTSLIGLRGEHQGNALGLLAFYRDQTDRDDPRRPTLAASTAKIVGIDLWGKLRLPLDGSLALTVEGELAHLRGATTRPWNDSTWQAGADVASWGAVGRVRLDCDSCALTVQLDTGYASGDADPRDATARSFSMHTDHNVGLVLFDHVLPLLSARSVDQIADPLLSAVPPPSARFAVQHGGVQNAVYLFPTLRWRPLLPLQLRLGYLLALTAADYFDPYQSALHGGYPTGVGGKAAASGAYGHEFDAKITWDLDLPGQLVARLGAEAGLVVPGAVLDGLPGLGTPWLARGLATLRW